jgi:hypothetical protein
MFIKRLVPLMSEIFKLYFLMLKFAPISFHFLHFFLSDLSVYDSDSLQTMRSLSLVGFRMHAQAELPINMTTIVMGTADATRSIHCR